MTNIPRPARMRPPVQRPADLTSALDKRGCSVPACISEPRRVAGIQVAGAAIPRTLHRLMDL